MTSYRFAGWLAFALLVVAISGCGSGLASVTGQVTVDGEPLRGGGDVRATVVFEPAGGSGRVAVGLVDSQGQYELSSGSKEGVEPGEYLVSCSAMELVHNPNGGPGGARMLTPESYASATTSGFRFTVEPGRNQYDLALNTSPSAAQ